MLPPQDIPQELMNEYGEGGHNLDLVGTIHVPRKLRDLTKQLPSPRYADSARGSQSSSIPSWKPKNDVGVFLSSASCPAAALICRTPYTTAVRFLSPQKFFS